MKRTSPRAAMSLLALTFAASAACVPPGEVSIGEFAPLSAAACAAKGGVPMSDPGDGSLFEQGCPDGDALGMLDDAELIEGGICCPAWPDGSW